MYCQLNGYKVKQYLCAHPRFELSTRICGIYVYNRIAKIMLSQSISYKTANIILIRKKLANSIIHLLIQRLENY